MATRLSAAARNAATAAIVALVDAGGSAGTLKVYTGAQPATGDSPATGTLLATIVLQDPAFDSTPTDGASNGFIPSPVAAIADGAAGWFRYEDSTGTDGWDGAVTATGGGGELELANVNLVTGVMVDVTALSYTTPAST